MLSATNESNLIGPVKTSLNQLIWLYAHVHGNEGINAK